MDYHYPGGDTIRTAGATAPAHHLKGELMNIRNKIKNMDKDQAIKALLDYAASLDELIDNTNNDERVWGAINARERFEDCINDASEG